MSTETAKFQDLHFLWEVEENLIQDTYTEFIEAKTLIDVIAFKTLNTSEEVKETFTQETLFSIIKQAEALCWILDEKIKTLADKTDKIQESITDYLSKRDSIDKGWRTSEYKQEQPTA
ncbi:MAG: hypothetical protein WCT77_13290 [Bacteroidota bacterium]|jgi:hypothetical protein